MQRKCSGLVANQKTRKAQAKATAPTYMFMARARASMCIYTYQFQRRPEWGPGMKSISHAVLCVVSVINTGLRVALLVVVCATQVYVLLHHLLTILSSSNTKDSQRNDPGTSKWNPPHTHTHCSSNILLLDN